jgi:hypothetical protein
MPAVRSEILLTPHWRCRVRALTQLPPPHRHAIGHDGSRPERRYAWRDSAQTQLTVQVIPLATSASTGRPLTWDASPTSGRPRPISVLCGVRRRFVAFVSSLPG